MSRLFSFLFWWADLLACHAYSFQSFSVGQVLQASHMNQVEVNIRDHVHGTASVVALTGAQGASLVFISQGVASNSASIDFTSIGSYASYMIILDRVIPGTDATKLLMRVSLGGSFRDTGSDYTNVNFRMAPSGSGAEGNEVGGGATALNISSDGETLGTGTDEIFNAIIWTGNMAQSSAKKRFIWDVSFYSATPVSLRHSGAGAFVQANTAVDGFRFLMSSGNIASGTFTLYGVRSA